VIEHKNKIGLIQIIAALLIVNHHTSVLKIPYLHYLTQGGFVINTIFVYLSGFLLAKSYNKTSNKNYYNFLEKRILRIYPSLHISLLFILIIYLFIGKNFSFYTILFSLTGFQYFLTTESLGPQMWFVSIILVCYILCIPTILFLKNKPFYFYLTLIFILISLLLNGEPYLYSNVNNIPIYRLYYHYIIFSFGLHVSLHRNDIEIFNISSALFIFFICLLVRFLLNFVNYLGLVKILTSVLIAFSVITLISESFNYFVRTFPNIFKLSSITYEIYLIHVAVIYFFYYIASKKLYTYPLIFIVSIALAFIISKLSTYYLKYIEGLNVNTKKIILSPD
jgi:peptidoglycan/LPS O-acetylase OafA/YrhL